MSATEVSEIYLKFVSDGIGHEHALALTIALVNRSQPRENM